jgi:hypothetical protein
LTQSSLSRPELLLRIAKRRGELEALVATLSLDALSAPRPDGWAITDHLYHVAAWESSLLALLRGESRAAAVGLSEAEEHSLDTDGINARIAEAGRKLSPDEVRRRFEETHREVLDQLESMSGTDLLLPYSHYQPNVPPYEARPVLGWVAGNTFEHYEEHIGWIKASLGTA